MKVGLFINTQFPESFNLAERVPEMVAQVRAARDAGFASLWFPHHWLTHPLQMLQITPIMGYIAAHAQGMTIGPNILILPALNPVHRALGGAGRPGRPSYAAACFDHAGCVVSAIGSESISERASRSESATIWDGAA